MYYWIRIMLPTMLKPDQALRAVIHDAKVIILAVNSNKSGRGSKLLEKWKGNDDERRP